jgi:cell wall-associated NlpC family hydrolase
VRVGVTLAAAAAALAVAAPPAPAAGVYAEVLRPDGQVVATESAPQFDYPTDGSLLHVGHVDLARDGVTLTDVVAVGSLLQAPQLYLPTGRGDVVGEVVAGGRVLEPAPNTIVPLGPAYAVLDQRATARGKLGRVGIRLVLTKPYAGVPAGTQVLLGVPSAERSATTGPRRGQLDPLAALGFASTDALAVGFVAAPSATSGSIGERAVAIAERFLGVPYVWGGASPVPGFDCSGLALYVYAQLGVTLTHYTGSQFREGLRLPRELLQPGDLVFFDDDPVRGPQHEGIYVGGGKFVQAPHTGDVVKISDLDDPRYGFSYVGAVRPYAAP